MSDNEYSVDFYRDLRDKFERKFPDYYVRSFNPGFTIYNKKNNLNSFEIPTAFMIAILKEK